MAHVSIAAEEDKQHLLGRARLTLLKDSQAKVTQMTIRALLTTSWIPSNLWSSLDGRL